VVEGYTDCMYHEGEEECSAAPERVITPLLPAAIDLMIFYLAHLKRD